MKKLLLPILAALLLSGCSLKFTSVTFNQESDEDGASVLSLNANGSNLKTDTDQTADGNLDLSEAIKAVKDAKSLGILGDLGNILGGGDEKQGELEVIQ